MINSTDRHLIGKNLKLKCISSATIKIDTVAVKHGGDLFLSMPRSILIRGQASAIVLGEKACQNVMSTKHLDGSSKVDAIELSDF